MDNNLTIFKLSYNPTQAKWLLFCSFFIILVNGIFAINNKVLSENISLENKETIITDISAALVLADNSRHINPKKFNQLLFELENKQTLFTAEQQDYYNFLQGYLSTYNGQYDRADELLSALLNSDANKLIKFRANYTLINVAGAKGNWTKGLQHIATNKKLLPTINNNKHYQGGLLTTITFYNQIKQYDLVLSHIKRLENEELSLNYQCFLKQLSLEVKLNLQQLRLNDSSFDTGLQLCQKAGNKVSEYIIRIYQARLLLKANNPFDALALIKPYIEDIENTLFPVLIAGMNNNLAKAYYQLNDLGNAKKHALEALNVNKDITIIQQAMDTYRLLYQITKKENDLRLALDYHEKYRELDRQHLEGEKAKHLAFQLAQHQAFEQESQIKLLNEKNNALAAEQALAKTQAANRKLIILLLGLVILAFTFIGIRFHRSHKRVKELAEYDPLTGIYNRGHFTHVTNSALKYCKNAQQDLSLIMFDLDHFKKVNDSFGHACGDWALKETIKVCQSIGRKNDIFARLGGEEFCLVLTSCTIDVAMQRAEACRAAIEEIITEESGCEFSITASFGVTDLKRSGFTLDKLLADADMAAYASKNAGRNRVTMFEVPETDKAKKLDNSWNYET